MKEPKELTNRELIDLIRNGHVIRSEHLNELLRRFWISLNDDFSKAQEEMNRAEAKFGKQLDIPSIPAVQNPFVWLGIVSEEEAKKQTNEAMQFNKLTWANVALEELCEVIGCNDDQSRRVELIQLMAVCARWIKAIDHQANKYK